MKIDFSARFYFAQIFVLFSALAIIFFAYCHQKWLLINWLQIMCTLRSVVRSLLSCSNGVHFIQIPLWLLKRHVEFNQRYQYSLLIYFLKISQVQKLRGEGEFQLKRTYLERGWGVASQRRTRANKGEGGQKSEILSERTF